MAMPALMGPTGWENWRAQLCGEPSAGTAEYSLWTDAHITGEEMGGLGPYEVLNALNVHVGRGRTGIGMLLSVDMHLAVQPEIDWAKSDPGYFHGAYLDEELAALVSLRLGSGAVPVVCLGSLRLMEILAGAR